MTNNLFSHGAWLEYYDSKAANLSPQIRANPTSLQSTMLNISRAALESRTKDLRASDSYTIKKFQTAFVGIIPFLKLTVSVGRSDAFIEEALLAFGLSDAPGLQDWARQLKATSSGIAELPMDYLKAYAKNFRLHG